LCWLYLLDDDADGDVGEDDVGDDDNDDDHAAVAAIVVVAVASADDEEEPCIKSFSFKVYVFVRIWMFNHP